MKSLGKYRLLANLGRGGMADIVLAAGLGPAGFSKLQVIKRLREEMLEEPEFVAMFLDEARLAARLNHPNLVQTFEVSEAEGEPFMVMEYLDGVPLNRLLARCRQRGEPVSARLGLRIVCDALAGLHYAHELRDYDGTPLGIVHRDASPHNIFVTYDGQVKLLDFGIAKASTHENETRAGVVKGKTHYMAPEQVRGAAVDRRTDVFIIGIVLWEVLAGAKMWGKLTEADVIRGLVQGKLPSLREAAPALAPELVAICERSLAPDPADRFASALELRSALVDHQSRAEGLADHEELGRLAERLFGDKREEIRRTIDEQLSGAAAASSLAPEPGQGGDTGLGSLPSLSTGKASSASALSESVGASTSAPEAAPASPARRPGPLALGVGAVALLAIGGVVAMARRPGPAPAAGPAAVAASAAAEAPAAPVAPAASGLAAGDPAAVELTVRALPASATLLLDGAPLPSNPFTGRFRRDSLQHQLRVEAPDHRPATRLVSFEQSLAIDLTLEPSERSRDRATRAPGAAPAAAPPTAAAAALPGAGSLGPAPSAGKRALSGDGGPGAPAATGTAKRKLGDNPFQ